MNDREFAEEFYKLKESLIKDYCSGEETTAVSKLIESMGLNSDQKSTMKRTLDLALTDALYTVLLGLEGSATIGEKQEFYNIVSEDGEEITGKDMEEHAWELFQND
jgi:hypothetical protein